LTWLFGIAVEPSRCADVLGELALDEGGAGIVRLGVREQPAAGPMADAVADGFPAAGNSSGFT
jgi:hypothetical protein